MGRGGRLLVGQRRQRGQTLIEFALILPFFLIFLFTVVDFGIALDRRITLQHAVREGARTAAVEADPAAGVDAAVRQSQDLVDAGDVSVCFVDQNDNGRADVLEPIKVSASFTYEFTVPFGSLLNALGMSVPTSIDMTPDATGALENDPAGAGFVECPP